MKRNIPINWETEGRTRAKRKSVKPVILESYMWRLTVIYKHMKTKLLLPVLACIITISGYAQNSTPTDTTFNHWSIDAGIGLTKPYHRFSKGYRSPTPGFFAGEIGVRYMFNELFGLKTGLGYDHFADDGPSPDFSTNEYRIDFQGVIGLGRLLRFEDWTRSINVLAHAGVGVGFLTFDNASNNDYVGNALAGITGQVKLSPRISLNMDFTGIVNIRQGRSFNGGIPASYNNDGMVFNGTVGISYYLGKNKKAADWYARADRYAAIDARLAELESEMKKANQDAARKNQSDVDELNQRIDKINNQMKPAPAKQEGDDFIARLINQGYVNIYFDFNSTKIEKNSASAINILRTYMKNNPGVSVNLIGYADEKGTEQYNQKLSQKRAEVVADLLQKAGIDKSRLHTEGRGEDTSVDKNSPEARQLARRVSFMIR